jgi:PadR family transcriptional regulator, regulatory protein PadR
LLDRTADFGFSRDPGGLYRVLRAIEREGLVASHWVASDTGPDRRLYQLTPSGREWLHAWARTLDETRKTLEDYLRRYRTLSDRESHDGRHEEQPGRRQGGGMTIDSRDVYDSIVGSKSV